MYNAILLMIGVILVPRFSRHDSTLTQHPVHK